MTFRRDDQIVHKYQPWVPAERRSGIDSPTFARLLTDSRMNPVVAELLARTNLDGLFELLIFISLGFDESSRALSSWEGLSGSQRTAAAKRVGNACRELQSGLRLMGVACGLAVGRLRARGEHHAADLLSALAGLSPEGDDSTEAEMSAAGEALLAIARSSEDWPELFHTRTGRNDETKLLRIAAVVVARELEFMEVRSWARMTSVIAGVMVPGAVEPGERAVRRIVRNSRTSGHKFRDGQE